MNANSVRRSGVHVMVHLSPTLGRTTESRMNSTTVSSAFMNPDGTRRSCLMYRRTKNVTTTNTSDATSQSMKTCLVTEKSIPPIVGR